MPGPYDYSLGAVPDPSAALMQGVQAGAGVHALGIQQQAQEQALRQQQQQSAVIQSLISKPNATAQDYANASLVLPPAMREQVKQSWDMRNTDQQQSVLQDTGKVFAALGSGQPQVAAQLLRGRAALLKETDANQAKALDAMAGVVDAHPEFARTLIGMHLASLPGGDKVIQNLSGLGVEQRAQDKAPVDLRAATAEAATKEAAAAVAPDVNAAELLKKQADAKTAAVQAKYADSVALADLEKKGWDVKNIQSEIGYRKESNRIAAMNAAATKEGNTLKREELRQKIDETRQKMDDAVRAKAADVGSAAGNIDNMLNTIERVKKSKGLREVVGSVEGSDFYPTQVAAAANALNPFTSSGDDRADAIALIEALSSQAFLSQLPNIKGMGQLSNIEGDKIQKSLQSLSRKQSEGQFNESIGEAARLLIKARENIVRRYGVAATKPDTPAAPGARPPLESFFK